MSGDDEFKDGIEGQRDLIRVRRERNTEIILRICSGEDVMQARRGLATDHRRSDDIIARRERQIIHHHRGSEENHGDETLLLGRDDGGK